MPKATQGIYIHKHYTLNYVYVYVHVYADIRVFAYVYVCVDVILFTCICMLEALASGKLLKARTLRPRRARPRSGPPWPPGPRRHGRGGSTESRLRLQTLQSNAYMYICYICTYVIIYVDVFWPKSSVYIYIWPTSFVYIYIYIERERGLEL